VNPSGTIVLVTAPRLAPTARPLALLAAILLGAGCNMIERADPKSKTTRSDQNFELDVEPILRGTVASETIMVGYQPTVVRGYGLVVGLEGTGSRLMPAEVRAQMIREMSRRGIGSHAYGAGELSPEAMLNSEDTAVVVVEGVIPAGAPKDTAFDVRVVAIPGSGTTSLEGGRLYTTDSSIRSSSPMRPAATRSTARAGGSSTAAAPARTSRSSCGSPRRATRGRPRSRARSTRCSRASPDRSATPRTDAAAIRSISRCRRPGAIVPRSS
jgi:uncharacterized protein YjeT (DUF2065 family)